jgi:hypothetical protein
MTKRKAQDVVASSTAAPAPPAPIVGSMVHFYDRHGALDVGGPFAAVVTAVSGMDVALWVMAPTHNFERGNVPYSHPGAENGTPRFWTWPLRS